MSPRAPPRVGTRAWDRARGACIRGTPHQRSIREIAPTTGARRTGPGLGFERDRGPAVGPDRAVGKLVLRRFPFAIAYQVLPDELVVLAIAHALRRPLYWLARTE